MDKKKEKINLKLIILSVDKGMKLQYQLDIVNEIIKLYIYFGKLLVFSVYLIVILFLILFKGNIKYIYRKKKIK